MKNDERACLNKLIERISFGFDNQEQLRRLRHPFQFILTAIRSRPGAPARSIFVAHRKKKMKTLLITTLIIMVVAACATLALGQDATEKLRTQLSDVQAKEAELQARERELDEAMRPENIERSLLGVGTTRPEELREQRRRQLDSERTRVRSQLEQLAQSRTRLEAAIATADAEAYRRSAQINTSSPQPQTEAQGTTATTTETQKAPAQKKKKKRRRARSQ
jgi:uncharacterized protein YlxW (UPF0749 family)